MTTTARRQDSVPLELVSTEDGWLPSSETRSFPDRPLYHWSPRARAGQIRRHGLRPGMRPTITAGSWRAPYVCFAEDPAWAWQLSGAFHPGSGLWDLWQTWLGLLTEIEYLESLDDDSARDFHEIRSHARVPKRHLVWVGERRTSDTGRRGRA